MRLSPSRVCPSLEENIKSMMASVNYYGFFLSCCRLHNLRWLQQPLTRRAVLHSATAPHALHALVLFKLRREGKTPFALCSSQGTAAPTWLLCSSLCHHRWQATAPRMGAAGLGTPHPHAPAPVAHCGSFSASSVCPSREGATIDLCLGPLSSPDATSLSSTWVPRASLTRRPSPVTTSPASHHRCSPTKMHRHGPISR
jgi:hypothetical protein